MELQQAFYDNSKTKTTSPSSGNIAANSNAIEPNREPNITVTSPVTSPTVEVENSDRIEPIILQKTNHVSTVLLYAIPIVSLFIEGQERLCLAQISNTLLKQFSYNEIHNRRVALGITCVQCTPVQLEILRRAGAMPISSRRCGMITRREAERLCKSFLGDNAPPRLPDDFAFSVFHKCAWGCRGSFLPARYNSSRAKCIKCSYCGMFFSPNKFIFHSHRINVNDKYVQPDAANFNSWRRHMMLSGHPPEEITHAWEDVKAMFNGGTRKRVISNRTSPMSTGSGETSKSNTIGSSGADMQQRCQSHISESNKIISNKHNNNNRNIGYTALSSPKRPREQNHIENNNNNNNVVSIKNSTTELGESNASSVAALAAVDRTQTPCNIPSSTATTSNGRNNNSDEMHLMPFSCSLMMDYMWQQHQKHSLQQQYQHHQQQQHQTTNQTKLKPFNGDNNVGVYDSSLPAKSTNYVQFPQCTYPWIKSSSPFSSATVAVVAAAAAAANQATSTTPASTSVNHHLHHPWQTEGPRKTVLSSESTIEAILAENFSSPYKRPSLYNRVCGESNSTPVRGVPLHQFNASAFKPVLQHNLTKGINDNTTTNSAATYSAISMTIATQNMPKVAPTILNASPPSAALSSQTLLPLLSTHLIFPRDASSSVASVSTKSLHHPDIIKESHSSEDDEDFHKISSEYCDDDDDDGDELVDIETTEDESVPSVVPMLPHQNYILGSRKVDEAFTSNLAAVSNSSPPHNQTPREFERNISPSNPVANIPDEIDIDGDDHENYQKQFNASSSKEIVSSSFSSIAALSQENVNTCERNNSMYVPLHTFNMNSNSSNEYPYIQSKSESNNTDSSIEIIDEFPSDINVDVMNINTGTTNSDDEIVARKFINAGVPMSSCRQEEQIVTPKFTGPFAVDMDNLDWKSMKNETYFFLNEKCDDIVCRSNKHRNTIANSNAKKMNGNRISNFNNSDFWTVANRFYMQQPFNYEVTTNLVSVQHSNSRNYQQFQKYYQQKRHFSCFPFESQHKYKRIAKRQPDHLPTKRMQPNNMT